MPNPVVTIRRDPVFQSPHGLPPCPLGTHHEIDMPSGPDFTPTKRGSGGKKNASCSFCRKSYREVGPLVEGPDDVYICGECIELCQSILEQEHRRRGDSKRLFTNVPTPREIVAHLDGYVIGQEQAKVQVGREEFGIQRQNLAIPLDGFRLPPELGVAERQVEGSSQVV